MGISLAQVTHLQKLNNKVDSSSNHQAIAELELVCPKCKEEIEHSKTQFYCASCDISYPILFGIPDFRLRSDQYLSLEDERKKALRLYEKGKEATFIELLEFYYSITDDVPDDLSKRYITYNLNAPKQSQTILNALNPQYDYSLLDLGCGSGGTLEASSENYKTIVGVDIALRWLVIANKRLTEQGIEANLICADVENLPFKSSSFDHIIANDLIEHVYDISMTSREITNTLNDGGEIWLTATNRYFPGPNPSTRVWAIGLIPKFARTWLLKLIRGVDSLRFIHLVSPIEIKNYFKSSLQLTYFGPKTVSTDSNIDYPLQDQVLMRLYQFFVRFKDMKVVLFYCGPAFEMIFTKNKFTSKE